MLDELGFRVDDYRNVCMYFLWNGYYLNKMINLIRLCSGKVDVSRFLNFQDGRNNQLVFISKTRFFLFCGCFPFETYSCWTLFFLVR